VLEIMTIFHSGRAFAARLFASLALVLVCGGLFFHRLGERDLWSSHEARAAMDAQSLLDAGSVGLPRLYDGRIDLQKPPLYYWLVAGIAWLRNADVDALAVRLPSALAAAGTVLAVGLGLAFGFGRPTAGLLASLLLATGIHFPWLARIGRIDMPLTLAVTLAGGSFALALHPDGRSRTRFLVAAYLACAAGVLLKGPIGLVLPGGIVAAFLLSEGRWPAFWEWRAWGRLFRELGAWWGLPLVLLVVLPIFLWMELASGGQLSREFFWHHNVERALGGSRLRSHPWFLYGPYFLLYLLPYSPLLLLAGVPRFWRDDPLARRGLAWAAAVLLVLSCSHFKRADYLLPAYPGAAVFLGCILERWLASEQRTIVLRGIIGVAAGMVIGWGVDLFWILPREEAYRDYRQFAGEVRRYAPAPAPVTFFRTEAHALAFRVGRPLAVIVEYTELQAQLERHGPHYLVMPPEVAKECRRVLRGVRLEEICRNTTLAGGKHERSLVLLRARRRALAADSR
jgi:4-amino-4-deoxy-L-arabinose transferase-like glycosyltransferase